MFFDVIIQARMNSKRLPGKVLLKVNNKTMLEYLIERVKKIKSTKNIIVATTLNKNDSKIKINLKQGVNIKDLYFIDLNGKKLLPKEYLRNKNTLEINVSNLVIGIYILQVESDREINKVKIIIER